MEPRKVLTDPEIALLIRDVVHANAADYISLGDPAFESIPCSKYRLYRVARSYCQRWGYVYAPVVNRSFVGGRLHPFDTVNNSKPGLSKVKT